MNIATTIKISSFDYKSDIDRAVSFGYDTVFVDMGGYKFKSHPEIAPNGISKENVDTLLGLLKETKLTVIPKLDFSTAHDLWLGIYARMIGSDEYYEVCRDVIKEVCDIFESKYLSIGMADENQEYVKPMEFSVCRNEWMFFRDISLLIENVKACAKEPIMDGEFVSDYRHCIEKHICKCIPLCYKTKETKEMLSELGYTLIDLRK